MLPIRTAKRTVIHRMASASLLALFVTNAFAGTAQALTENTWEAVGQAGFSQSTAFGIDLAFNPLNNQPYVVYGNGTGPYTGVPLSVTVKTYDGTSWTTVGGSDVTSDGAGEFFIKLAFNPVTNEPYVLYSTQSQQLEVKRFDGTAWVRVGSGYVATSAYNSRLAFDASGTPYVAYNIYTSGIRHVVVKKFDGTSWVQEGNSFNEGAGASDVVVGIAIDPDTQKPYVLYCDDTDVAAVHFAVRRFDGSEWVKVGAGVDSGGSGRRIDFGFNPVTHELYIAHVSATLNSIDLEKFDGTNWILVGNKWPIQVSPPFGSLDLEFSPSTGTPYIVYERMPNSSTPQVIVLDGSSWSALENSEFHAGNANVVEMAFNPKTGNPNVAYLDATLGYKATVMKYIPVDTIAPTTNATVSGQLVAGSTDTYIGTTTVSLTATDNPDGMGLANTYVSVDGGAFSAVATTSFPYVLTATSLGAHTVQYYSTDLKGNQEATKTTTFTITQESQPTNGSISGMVFKDDNRNGVRDAGERAALWVLYIDANGNNRLDWGEKIAVTNCDGEYHFNNLSAGTYTVREIDRPLWIQTAPTSGEYEVTLTAGQNATGKDFGNDVRW